MIKFLSKFFYGVFILLLLGVTTLFLVPMLPIQGNIEIKIVKSGSMEPAIQTGSIVVIQPTEDYKVGDIITFGEDTPSSYPTTHRIANISKSGSETIYQTKGDANEEVDPSPVTGADIIGEVIFTIPAAGFVLDFARQPIGFILLIAFPAALVILNELLDITKEIRKVIRRKKEGENSESHTPNSMLVVAAFVFFGLSLVLIQPGKTISYFADKEESVGNTMSAISFRILATALPRESYVGHTGGSTIVSTVSPNPVGLPNEYKVTVEKVSGSDAFCQALIMTSSSIAPFAYTGSLLNFVSPPTTYAGDWTFNVNLDPNANVGDEDECTINLVYSASTWLEDKLMHAGYSDTERVLLTFEASEYHHEETSEINSLSTFNISENIVEQVDDNATTTATSTQEVVPDATSTQPVVEEEESEDEPVADIEPKPAESAPVEETPPETPENVTE